MEPDYFQGDFLISVSFGSIKVGSDVVFCDPRGGNRRLLKRVVNKKNGKVFVMGLNESFTTDSREFGWIEENMVLGKVILRYYPLFGRGKFWFW